MKYLKMSGVAVIAAMALIVFLGAGSASGTLLCTENKDPCPGGEDYAAGTTIHAVLEEGKETTLSGIWTDVKCQESTIQGKTENTGAIGEAVQAPVESLSFGKCLCAGGGAGTAHVTVLEKGSLEVQHVSGTDDGTITGRSQRITIDCTALGSQCIFGTKSEGTDLGTLTGGNPATLDGSATLGLFSGTNDEGTFICGSTAKWEAAYDVTSPKPLHVVAASGAGAVLCTENKDPCPGGEDYAAGTTIHAVLEEGKEATLSSGIWTDVKCQESTIQGKTENTGGSGEAVRVQVESLSFGKCSCVGGAAGNTHVTVLEKGSLEVKNIASSDDGTITGKRQRLTVNCTAVAPPCIFGTDAEGTDVGTLTGGNPATVDGSAAVSHFTGTNDGGTFLCGSTAKWEAAYEVTSPKPLHVVGG